MTEYVIASTKMLTVWDFYSSLENAETALPEVKQGYLNDAAKVTEYHALYGYSGSDWLQQAEAYRIKAEDSRVMTFDEYQAAEADQILSRPIQEISAAEYDDALNVLPPMRWGSNNGVLSFFMSEFHSGNYTTQYARICNRYFCKLVNYHKPETWITARMIDVHIILN